MPVVPERMTLDTPRRQLEWPAALPRSIWGVPRSLLPVAAALLLFGAGLDAVVVTRALRSDAERFHVLYRAACPSAGPFCDRIQRLQEDPDEWEMVIGQVPAPGRDESVVVVVVERGSRRSACDGDALWFVELSRDKPVLFSAPIDYCGGPVPRVFSGADGVHLAVPSHRISPSTGALAAFDYTLEPASHAVRVRW